MTEDLLNRDREGASKDLLNRDREGVSKDLLNRDREGVLTNYLITWVCYGTWLPGQGGAVPLGQNRFGAPLPEPDARIEKQSRIRMLHDPYLLDAFCRRVVLRTLREVCACRGWTLLAAHIRTNHIHVVIRGSSKPERMLIAMKAYSSRALNEQALDDPGCRHWARHGSTRYLWTEDAVRAAIRYVVHKQGEPMCVFERPSLTLGVQKEAV